MFWCHDVGILKSVLALCRDSSMLPDLSEHSPQLHRPPPGQSDGGSEGDKSLRRMRKFTALSKN